MTENDRGTEFNGARVALGITGGIAAYKAAEILRGLQRAGCEVRVCMTRHACEFVQPLTFRSLSGSYVIVDDYAPDNPDPIAHITYSQTVDLFVIAPATANAIAKIANGIADDFLTSTYLACNAPVLVAPAMNTVMWEHPATRRNLEKLRADGVHIVDPDQGEMACGTFGPGRLSEPDRIVDAALAILEERSVPGVTRKDKADFSDEHILITTGATREPLDPVRFISNRSSGKMGFALAEAARTRGAEVTVVAGNTTAPAPAGMSIVTTLSAEEMHQAVMREAETATVFIAAAAVSDYRPANPSPSKIKKSEAKLTLTLERTPDILNEVSRARRSGQIIVGFAAETSDVLAFARQKLTDKKLDMIVANDVTKEDAGFDSENNRISIILRDDSAAIELPLMTKSAAAHRILDEVARIRRQQNSAKSARSKS